MQNPHSLLGCFNVSWLAQTVAPNSFLKHRFVPKITLDNECHTLHFAIQLLSTFNDDSGGWVVMWKTPHGVSWSMTARPRQQVATQGDWAIAMMMMMIANCKLGNCHDDDDCHIWTRSLPIVMIRRIGKCATNNDDHYYAHNCQCWWLLTSWGRLASNEIQMVGLDLEDEEDRALEQALSVSYKSTKFEQIKAHFWVDQHSCFYSLKHIKWSDSWHSHSHTAILLKKIL